MHNTYHEILQHMGEPVWWDEYAVPRFVPFSPEESAYIYADQVALVEIHCQGCGQPFAVCFSSGRMEAFQKNDLKSRIAERKLEYGDPPNKPCCAAGPTMSSIPIKVLELWQTTTGIGSERWTRVTEFDNADITPEWASEPLSESDVLSGLDEAL